MNAYIIAMVTAAAVTLAALAAGLIIAGRRSPGGPFPGLTGSLPCWQEAHAGQLSPDLHTDARRGHIRVLHLTGHDKRPRGIDHGSARSAGPAGPAESFPTDPTGLPEATRPALLELADGDDLDLQVGPVAKRLGDTTVRMLGYNGSIPGPTLKVRQGSEIIVHVTNEGDLDTTVHWHGLRLENKYDGVPHETQTPIPVGGSFTYRMRFPDPGLYWYHPHIREDYTQEMGLYGNILVVPADPRLLAARAPGGPADPG